MYTCIYGDGTLDEGIMREGRTLTSHVLLLNHPLESDRTWSRAFVEKYGKENGLSFSALPFSCSTVGEALSRGSIDTLETSSLKHEDLDPR